MKTKVQVAELTQAQLDGMHARAGVQRLGERLDADEVRDLAKKAEDRLRALDIPESARNGSTLAWRPAGPWAKSYGHSKDVVRYKLARRAGKWQLVDLGRDTVYPKTPELFRLKPTAKGIAISVRNAIRDVTGGGAFALPHASAEMILAVLDRDRETSEISNDEKAVLRAQAKKFVGR